MKIVPTPIQGCFELEVVPFQDFRGEFSRVFCQRELAEVGVSFSVAQSNYSKTLHQGTVRGLHYQVAPHTEAKLIRVDHGSIFDVCVDLRKNSPTFGHWHGVNLTAENRRMLLLPKGCAHGFQALEDNVEMTYLHDEFYDKASDRTAHHLDPRFQIRWPLPITLVSEKDKNASFFTPEFRGIDL